MVKAMPYPNPCVPKALRRLAPLGLAGSLSARKIKVKSRGQECPRHTINCYFVFRVDLSG